MIRIGLNPDSAQKLGNISGRGVGISASLEVGMFSPLLCSLLKHSRLP